MKAKTQADQAAEFLKLHQGPKILVLANVWDVVSARLVERAGFPALATSSSAVANSLGYPDGQRIPREEMLAVVRRIASKVSVPVTADLESGYGTSREAVAATARGLVEAGAVGLNFEDGTGNLQTPLFDQAAQEEKIRWLRAAGDELGVHVVINARTDVFLDQVGEPAGRFNHAVSRLNAYRRAGADCLFAPGVDDSETIGKLAEALDGPLNILAGPKTPPLAKLEKLGVARVSFGSWAMRGTMSAFDRFLVELRDRGTFTSLQADITYAEMNKLVE
jgi:2-methylisocitrate lyase-like PEP mutase family enzyme